MLLFLRLTATSRTRSSLLPLRKLLLLFSLILLLSSPAPQLVAEGATLDELRALLEFKKGIHKDPTGKVTSSWNSTAVSLSADADICPHSFYGITCDETTNSISEIILDQLDLGGELKFNTLLPLKSLRKLSLVGNSLTGRLVPQLGTVSSLEYIDLSNNNFIGRIPDRIHDLWGLQHLNLSHNGFSGGYPTGIRNLQQLRVLDLHDNELWGDVGLFFSELRNAEFVDLSGNSFSGRLPRGSQEMSSLGNTVRHLNLSGNMVSGGFLSNETLGLFKNLEVLDLAGNRVGGELPGFGSLFNLKVLRLRDNELFGEVPVELVSSSLPLLELDLSGNGFSGSIHGINSTTLEILDLSSNQLTGNFPEFSSQSGLTVLRISNNSLEGSLPSDWLHFSRLSKIDLSINKFAGAIPTGLFALNLLELNLSGNHLNGAIPFPQSKVSELLAEPVFAPLESLDLSDNSLTGHLSSEISYMRRLRTLNLAKNSLSGRIPDTLGKIGELEFLDLSNNHFEGHLPHKLPSSLTLLNVTYNKLSGTVPESLRSFPPSSFHPGNEKLVIPGVEESPNGGNGYLAERSRHRSSKSSIKVAIIVASIGAALMIAFVSLAYYRAQLHSFHGRSKFDDTTAGRDVKGGRFPRPSLFKFPGGTVPPQSSTSFSSDLLLTANSRTMSGQAELAPEIVEHAPEPATSGAYLKPNIPDQPLVTSARKSPPGSPLPSSPRFLEAFEQPVTLDVYSPDRFAGELYFLDASLSFTAEQLSRAPAEVLGRSSHGTLYKATLDAGLILTVKWLRVGLVKNKKEFAKEVKKIGSLRHPNIVSVRAYYWGPKEQERLILLDYVHADSLALHLYESTPRRHSRLSFSQRLKVAVEVARGLVFLHDRGMPHGNLKPTNILLSGPNVSVQLTDYGLHRLMTPTGIAEQILNLGALGYCAPELSGASKPVPSLKADVYALGVIIMELLTRRSAGDIISGQSGAVDLTDWVRLCDQEGRRMDCVDRDIAGREEPSRAMEDMLGISLRCILPVNERPNIRQVYDDLCSISG